jgi:hypothetical protein
MLDNMENNDLTRLKDKIIKLTSNRPGVTDIIAKFIITFGVVLLISGLALMLADSSLIAQTLLSDTAVDTAVGVISWVPGVPFNANELIIFNVTTAGLVAWISGIDLLLIGLGIWVKHRLAQLVAVVMFGLSAVFQFQQFLTLGINGAPASITGIVINGVITYYLFMTFNWAKHSNAQQPLNIQK